MRLTELNPQWLYHNAHRVGFIFQSPLHLDNPERDAR